MGKKFKPDQNNPDPWAYQQCRQVWIFHNVPGTINDPFGRFMPALRAHLMSLPRTEHTVTASLCWRIREVRLGEFQFAPAAVAATAKLPLGSSAGSTGNAFHRLATPLLMGGGNSPDKIPAAWPFTPTPMSHPIAVGTFTIVGGGQASNPYYLLPAPRPPSQRQMPRN